MGLISCGETLETPKGFDQNLNQTWSVEADDFFSQNEKILAQDFCGSMAAKYLLFSSQYINAKKVRFEISSKSCESSSYGDSKTIEVGIKDQNSGFYFETGTFFPDIITRLHPEVSALCEGTKSSEDVVRVDVNGSKARWYMLSNEEDNDCGEVDDDKAICLKVYTGIKEDNGSGYKITKMEFFKTTPESVKKEGVIVKRELQTTLPCDGSAFQSQLQEVKAL